YGAEPFPLSASATSGLPLFLTLSNSGVVHLEGATVTVLAPGTCDITASQDGNANWHPAAPVARQLVVTGTVFRLWLRQDGSDLLELRFGETDAATDAPDDSLDVPAPIEETTPVWAYLETSGDTPADLGPKLMHDFRPVRYPTRWRLVTLATAPSAGVTELIWSATAADPARLCFLQRLDDEKKEQAAGLPVDMAAASSVVILPGDVYEIAYAWPAAAEYRLQRGWNLVGGALYSLTPSGGAFTDGGKGTLLQGLPWFLSPDGMVPCEPEEPLLPECAYWVLATTDATTAPVMGILADGWVTLLPGGNVISPVTDCIDPIPPEIPASIWTWDAGLRSYLQIPRGGILEAGRGYWITLGGEAPVTVRFSAAD
ncbi:MAG: hypothetical protein JXR77_16655, partial [Lentisphaeria bacterium]|nr:hypothetical protein [Lentisphaeria bacterium]